MSDHLIDDLPPMPEPAVIGENSLGGDLNLYTAEQVHSVVLADRALRGDGKGEPCPECEGRGYDNHGTHDPCEDCGGTGLAAGPAAKAALEKCARWIAAESAIRGYGPNFMDEVSAALRSLGGKQ